MNFIKSVYNDFIDNKLTYPCRHPYIMEEIAAVITLGKIEHFTFGLLDNKVSPWYIEYEQNVVRNKGVVMHIWNSKYKEYLIDIEGMEELKLHDVN